MWTQEEGKWKGIRRITGEKWKRKGIRGGREVYRRESNLAISSSPVKNNYVQFYLAYCYRVKHKKISSSGPGLSVTTLRECCVDRPLSDHMIR